MRHLGLGWVVLAGLCFPGISAWAETSLDVLEKDLSQIKKEHQDASSQFFSDFLNQLDAAVRSPDAALTLYQEAGGDMPDPADVLTVHNSETPDEKADRLAVDDSRNASLAGVVQIHCGLMHYAAFFIQNPDASGLHDAWVAWLKTVAQTYPQVGITPADPRPRPAPPVEDTPKDDSSAPPKPKKKPPLPPDRIRNFKSVTMQDSPISIYLGFRSWGDKPQAHWSVKQVPDLYRSEVLEPLRATPSAETLAAWDTYIAMKNADQTDPDQWSQVDYPSMAFDRACDAYTITPTMEKLQALIEIIKANPTHPKLDDMIARAHDLVLDFSSRHPGAATPPSPGQPSADDTTATNSAVTNANVTITTVSQGDMTIITTHTNAPPANPSAPVPPAPVPASGH